MDRTDQFFLWIFFYLQIRKRVRMRDEYIDADEKATSHCRSHFFNRTSLYLTWLFTDLHCTLILFCFHSQTPSVTVSYFFHQGSVGKEVFFFPFIPSRVLKKIKNKERKQKIPSNTKHEFAVKGSDRSRIFIYLLITTAVPQGRTGCQYMKLKGSMN